MSKKQIVIILSEDDAFWLQNLLAEKYMQEEADLNPLKLNYYPFKSRTLEIARIHDTITEALRKETQDLEDDI